VELEKGLEKELIQPGALKNPFRDSDKKCGNLDKENCLTGAIPGKNCTWNNTDEICKNWTAGSPTASPTAAALRPGDDAVPTVIVPLPAASKPLVLASKPLVLALSMYLIYHFEGGRSKNIPQIMVNIPDRMNNIETLHRCCGELPLFRVSVLDRILIIWFSSGAPFGKEHIKLFELHPEILDAIKTSEYDDIIICGHSMGAGLSYLFTLKLCDLIRANEKTGLGRTVLGRVFDFKHLHVCTTGLGRVPSETADHFKTIHNIYKFNYIDLIALHKSDGTWRCDDFLDDIMIETNTCDPRRADEGGSPAPYYCKNRSIWNLTPRLDQGNAKPGGMYDASSPIEQDKELDKASRTGKITEEERKDYNGNNCWERNWGEIYGERWNKCQDLFNHFYKHNEVNTFSIDNEGTFSRVDKQGLLKKLKITETSYNAEIGLATYHKVSYYYHCFKSLS